MLTGPSLIAQMAGAARGIHPPMPATTPTWAGRYDQTHRAPRPRSRDHEPLAAGWVTPQALCVERGPGQTRATQQGGFHEHGCTDHHYQFPFAGEL